MNNPDDIAIDVQEMRDWINAHKQQGSLSWSGLADASGIPAGTLSPFCAGSYAGRNDKVAVQVYRYKQMVETQAKRADGVPTDPGYFETPTSLRLRALLQIGHMGRITLGATGPGTGKTMTMREYQASVSNCWVATMCPTTKTLNSMLHEVIRAIGGVTKGGWTRQLSQQVRERVGGRRGLLVIDEANHLELESLEEIRSWHDLTGVGICLLGNEELIMRIQGGPRRDAYARLNSRIAQSHVQNLPVEGDVEAFCDAWDIRDAGMRELLRRTALTPGAGGLRECRQIVEGATMLAQIDERPMSFADLRDAQASRSTRLLRN